MICCYLQIMTCHHHACLACTSKHGSSHAYHEDLHLLKWAKFQLDQWQIFFWRLAVNVSNITRLAFKLLILAWRNDRFCENSVLYINSLNYSWFRFVMTSYSSLSTGKHCMCMNLEQLSHSSLTEWLNTLPLQIGHLETAIYTGW